MPTVEAVIVKCSKNPLAGLYDAGMKAVENPARGVEIKNKTAFYVIRDCAKTTLKWLPLELLLEFEDVKAVLKGKLSISEITEFTKRALSGKEQNTTQLLRAILEAMKFKIGNIEPPKQETPAHQYEDDINLSNVYGEYSTIEDIKPATVVEEAPVQEAKLTDNEHIIIAFLTTELT